MTKILVGADPELFVKHNGKFVSAHGLIHGDKRNPFKVERGAVQVDGMALEFNIEPAASDDEFYLNMTTVMDILKGMVPDHEFALVPVAEFGKEYIDSQPPEAKELGCDPDFDAWTGHVNEKPNVGLPFRTASGHVHIGWTKDMPTEEIFHVDACRAVARQMDFFLGLPSLLFDRDTKRREMYGNGGCFRPKSYGVEYRTLSNAWLKSESLIRWVFHNTQKGMKALMEGRDLSQEFGDVRQIIKNSDVNAAEKIINAAGIEVCHA